MFQHGLTCLKPSSTIFNPAFSVGFLAQAAEHRGEVEITTGATIHTAGQIPEIGLEKDWRRDFGAKSQTQGGLFAEISHRTDKRARKNGKGHPVGKGSWARDSFFSKSKGYTGLLFIEFVVFHWRSVL